MGNKGDCCATCCDDKETEMKMQINSKDTKTNDRGNSKDVSELKYYGEMKQEHAKRIAAIQRGIDDKEREI